MLFARHDIVVISAVYPSSQLTVAVLSYVVVTSSSCFEPFSTTGGVEQSNKTIRMRQASYDNRLRHIHIYSTGFRNDMASEIPTATG